MPVRRPTGFVGRLMEVVEERAGVALVDQSELRLMEQGMVDLRVMARENEMLGYGVLDYFSGQPKEVRPEQRQVMAQKALMLWLTDAQFYRATELLIDFAFGRGVPQPRAKEKAVQRVLDEFWSDPDNRLVVSTAEAQRALARDLLIQSNVFPLIFDGGDDSKVKTGLLSHDSVRNAIRDDDNRLRVLYYSSAEKKLKYDYNQDRYVPDATLVQPKVTYYEHWSNVRAMESEGVQFDKPPSAKIGDGKVYHLVENRTMEMVFGIPMAQRGIRWLAAYNDFQAARVDMMKAAAAFIMKRRIKGTPNQLAKLATKQISRSSPLAGSLDVPDMPVAGRAASILNENDTVDHEPLKLDTGSGNATQDADMLHGQIAAATGLPKHYLGSSDANLATATAMELFVIKRVEAFQEIFESFYRALFDRAIERAQETGKLDQYAEEEGGEEPIYAEMEDPYTRAVAAAAFLDDEQREKIIAAFRSIREAYEDAAQDEQDTGVDLSYEFSMPSPLKRTISDLAAAIQIIAQTFDPNNTNVELSRGLLAIAAGEILEVDDPAAFVEKALPPGYVDPMFAMAAEQGGAGGGGEQPPGAPAAPGAAATGSELTRQPGGANVPAGAGNSYGAPMQSQTPEKAQEANIVLRDRSGNVIFRGPVRLTEQRLVDDELLATRVRGHAVGLDALFDSEVGAIAMRELELAAAVAGSNGAAAGTNGHPSEEG